MTPIPLDLPLRPPEAGELANLVFELAEGKPLTDEIRGRIAARAAPLKLESIVPWFGSLDRDPVHRSTYYLAVDVREGPPQLLHMAPATAPTSGVFQKPLLIGRMRRARGPEIVINTVPFGPDDTENIDKLASLDPAFLPRQHGPRLALVAQTSMAAFETFRAILTRTRQNVASVTGPYHAAVWAAIRSGWRGGYSAALELPITDEESFGAARESIRQCPRYSRFIVRGSVTDVERLSVWIRQTRSAAKVNGPFELGIATGAADLAACLQALKDTGHTAQIAAPAKGDPAELAAVARQFNCTLSVQASDYSEEELKALARETAGRLSCAGSIAELAEILLG